MTEDEHIEEHGETGADEAPEVVQERDWEAEARAGGWRPKDEWDGDPDTWRDAETFVKKGEEINSYLKRDRDRERQERERKEREFDERMKRIESANRAAIKRMAEQHEVEIKALKAQRRKAVEDGDTDTFEALDQKIEAFGPPPEVPDDEPKAEQPDQDPIAKEWLEKNPWFHSDPVMGSYANAAATEVAQAGGDVKAQIEAAEAEARRRFPQKFGIDRRQTVETAGRTPRPKKEKGVSELPREAREAFNEFVRAGVYKKEDIGRYAKDYWSEA